MRRIPDGRVVRRRCDDCDEVTEWVECDMKDRIHLFGVSLLDTTSRRFVCMVCGEDVHPDDVAPRSVRRAPPPAAPPAELPPRSTRDVAYVSERRPGPHHPEIDEEIAAIKRRLGKR